MKKLCCKKYKKILISVLLFIILLLSTVFAIINVNNDRVINGIFIENVDVSNYSKNELSNKINELIDINNNCMIKLKYKELEIPISIGSLKLKYNQDEIKNDIFSVGREGNIFINNYKIAYSNIFKNKYLFNLQLNEDTIEDLIKTLNNELPGIVKESEYYIEDNNLIITKGKDGILVNKSELSKLLLKSINDFSDNEKIIEIPILNVKPNSIDIDKIHNEIYKEVKDADITNDPITVHPDITGVDFDMSMDDINNLLKQDKDEYIIPLKYTKANKTIKDIGKEAFPNKLGSFVTKYDVQNENRVNNINLATNKINGIVIMPGEVFSYNQIVGKRTLESGYKEAGSYVQGQVVQEVGGGICQVSSTLYNAVLYANLDIIERYNHYFESSYVESGRDATVSWGSVDFKFKNTRKYPIKIEATSKNGVENVNIMGIKEENEYEVIIQSKKTSKIERKIQYIDDDSIERDKEEIVQSGHDGCTSETYKILKQGDKIVSNTLISSDRYNALDRIIKKGTK